MKPRKFSRKTLSLCSALACITQVHAQSTWTGATAGEWGSAGNWTGGVPNATNAVANINTALTVNLSDTGSGGTYPYTFGTLATSLATGNVVIGSNSGTGDILSAATSSATPVVHVANSAASIFFYANLEGTQGFEKTGAGKLTFRFNGADQNYSGDIKISAGVLGINQNSSLGDDNNDLIIANGARLLAEPGSNSGTISLPSTRNITLTGAQSQIGSSNANVNLVINGTVTEDAANKGLVKTDAGKVTLAGTISYTGETRIAAGTLALAGSAALPSSQNFRFNGSTGTLDLGGTSQTIRTLVLDNTAGNKSITGGGSLLINGDAVLQLSANNGVTYDLSGIDAFTFNRATRAFNIQTVNVTSTTTISDLNLAKSGASGGTNAITASAMLVGGGNSDGNNGNTARLHLGTNNSIHSTSLQVGGFNAGGIIDFQSGLSTPYLKLRGTDGTSAMSSWKIGETSSGSRRGEGTVNLSGGSLDALVGDLSIGRHLSNASIDDTSSLSMPSGSLVATNIVLAEKTGTGTPTLTSTMTQAGGMVSTTTLTLGKDAAAGASARLLPSYHLNGGTLHATTITAGTGAYAANSARNLNLAGGTLRNAAGTDLSIQGLDSSTAGRINLNVTASSSIHADAEHSVTLANFSQLSGTGPLSKTGAGSLFINANSSSFSGTLTVSDGTLGGASSLGGSLNVQSGASFAPGNSPGTFSIGGDLSLAGNFDFQFTGGGTPADLVNVGGTLNLSGSTVSWENLGAYTLADKFTLFSYSGTLTGTFTDHDIDDASYTFGGGLWRLNYDDAEAGLNGGTGTKFVTITAVPEPHAAVLGTLGLLALLRRRRQS